MNVETVVLKVKDSKELERYMHLLEISTISREALKEDGEISIKYKGNNLENYIDGSTFFALYVAGRLLGTVYERLRKDDDWDDKARENAFDLLAGGIYSYLVDKHDGDGLSQGRLRTRLFVNGAVNEDWTYTARFENNQYLDDNKGTDDVKLNWAYVTGKVGGVKVEAGRQDFTNVGGTVIDTRGDGIKLAYGSDVKVYGWALKGSDDLAQVEDDPDTTVNEFEEGLTSDDRVYVAGVAAKMGVVDAAVNYYKVDTEYDQDIYEIAAGWEFMDDLTLKAAWYNGDVSDSEGDDNGWMVGLNYAGAKASKVGSWGAYVNYMDRPWNTVIYPTLASYTSVPETLATDVDGDGYKGIEAGANLTVAKNIVAGVKYYNLDSREGDANTETIWSEVIFTF